MPLDERDLTIIKLLKTDVRMSYASMADTLGLSRATVRNRIQRMVSEDLVIMSARVNIKKQGGKMAMLGLEVKSEENWDECLAMLESLPWVLMGFRAMGKSNLRVLVYGESDEILEHNIDAFRYYHCVNFIEAEILGKPIVSNI
ncbi:MAG: AsnC family transcriptional regulator [Candidatus Bathyarchaeota archaeon]|nr:AsnC family transcriptional regulator [Candidatus Bathyarchaeota archaeon]